MPEFIPVQKILPVQRKTAHVSHGYCGLRGLYKRTNYEDTLLVPGESYSLVIDASAPIL